MYDVPAGTEWVLPSDMLVAVKHALAASNFEASQDPTSEADPDVSAAMQQLDEVTYIVHTSINKAAVSLTTCCQIATLSLLHTILLVIVGSILGLNIASQALQRT